jgi:hypothetical protein
MVLQKARYQVGVVDISLNENKPGILIRSDEIASPPLGTELVDNDESFESICSQKVTRES